MWIIAGEFRGRTLKAPKGEGTRPTTDRVREAMMSTVHSARGGFDDAVVLDAFAGSGALGLEALSRGARSVQFCERGGEALRALNANVRLLGLDARDARIALSANTFDIDRLALQSAWTGEYVGLWRGPEPALPADVAAFQNARGLKTDGVAGPETMMALASDAPGPHLLRVLE